MDFVRLIFLLIFGACVGSFLNVLIYRMPRGQSIVFPPSHCPKCGRSIKWYDNIPLASWFFLRGKCRFCKAAISPQYLAIEAATAGIIGGLYACYYMLQIRTGAGPLAQSWPMFVAHAALLCGLLACSIVDVQTWTVPLEICWFASVLGIAGSAASPHRFMPTVSPAAGAMALAAAIGLAVALVLKRYGLIRESFIDASDRPRATAQQRTETAERNYAPPAVAFTAAHGVNPRKEILLEVAFLAPAVGLAVAAGLLVTKVPAAREAWQGLLDEATAGRFAAHFRGLLAALLGYLVGGLWVWSMRIFGTLGFGKEAMGLGDVHIMAAVGAVTGWIVPSLAFFVAPIFGLLWAISLYVSRGQREMPYGPWLAAGTLVVMLFYDGFCEFLGPLADVFGTVGG